MYNPASTYRIQFNKDFTFNELKKHLDYFALLGTGTIYASPVFAAVPASMHGYDVTDPRILNPEIGTHEEFIELSLDLKKRNIGWLQDIVPNHMAFDQHNSWLMDVLEKGTNSQYASYFDIDFNHPSLDGKLLVPFLAASEKEAVECGEIKLVFRNHSFYFEYYKLLFPVNRGSLINLLKEDVNPKLNLLSKTIESAEALDFSEIADAVNADITKLKELLSAQHYRLSFWQETGKNLNYRRFFTINSLICMQMESDRVFEDTHSLISELISKNLIRGIRIDHIDGLKYPAQYIDKLRKLTGNSTYIIAEKILQPDEELPVQWPLQGTTGYDFLAIVNNLLTRKSGSGKLKAYYDKITGKRIPEKINYQNKKKILMNNMMGDLENLTRSFYDSGMLQLVSNKDITHDSIRDAIGEFLLACPRYRLYSGSLPLSFDDTCIIKEMVANATIRNPGLNLPLKFVEDLLTGKYNGFQEEAADFFRRCMAYTGPLTAKGVEDTSMYDYNWFVVHNEVGDSINAKGLSVKEFHELMLRRLENWPFTLNTTSTHDTKRGEDTRARLQVISEIADDWIKRSEVWFKNNRKFKSIDNSRKIPDPNEEYLIYQTLAGVWPYGSKINKNFTERIEAYILKALREAKVHSDWIKPDAEYENAIILFLRKILKPGGSFLNAFLPFQSKLAGYGIINSLVQLTLKATCPGIPDIYQGTELYDLSLVDPDNRHKVGFENLDKVLSDLGDLYSKNPGEILKKLFGRKESGEIKMWYTHRLLTERFHDRDFYVHGEYIPLLVKGKLKRNVIAFARKFNNKWVLVIAPLYTAALLENEISGYIDWSDTRIILPDSSPENWECVLGSGTIYAKGEMHAGALFNISVPRVFSSKSESSKRGAGILLHLTSLPGLYGTGDMGQNAGSFIDFLAESSQKYWQILPVNPVTSVSSYSPYSTPSAFAGNILLTDPEWLVKHGLIRPERIRSKEFKPTDRCDFNKAGEFRKKIISEAFTNFKSGKPAWLQNEFEAFCSGENEWLDDYSLFEIIKKEFKGRSWIKWPQELRDRHKSALNRIKKIHKAELEEEKFRQFIFLQQWKQMKNYANKKGIKIIGDVSFYVSYESADVWQNPDIFKLRSDKKMAFVGGAPPDYFSETGQLWNMPVYDWDRMKEDDYLWWRRRVKKNMEWFDLVRFDHFRGFSAFWEVPAGHQTASNGHWTEAGGRDLFRRLKDEFPSMPFIAEDLGAIDDTVYELRDSFGLPGMKVLQFAFTDAAERSVHLPHNYQPECIVYTGTHDNNTSKGWFRNELSTKHKKYAENYSGKKLNSRSVTDELIRLAYSSVANIVIIPVQDILGLGQEARLNNPANTKDNWLWKLTSLDDLHTRVKKLKDITKLYRRS